MISKKVNLTLLIVETTIWCLSPAFSNNDVLYIFGNVQFVSHQK